MSDTTTTLDIQNEVIAAIIEVCPDTDQSTLSGETTFESIDVDSLDLVEIAQIVGDAHSIKIKGDGLEDLRTIADAAELIARESA